MASPRLTRDLENAMLGGVCAGIANRLDFDPTLVRVATVLLFSVTGGTALLVYFALWLLMPKPGASGRPTVSGVNEELRDAADRVQEAAGILARAARQAADDLSDASKRRAPSAAGTGAPSPPPWEPQVPTPSGEGAAPGQPPTIPGTPSPPTTPGTPPEPDPSPPTPPPSPPQPSTPPNPIPPQPMGGEPEQPRT